MFKARVAPKNARRKAAEEDDESEADGTCEKLAEVREIQRECWRKVRGVPPAPELMKREVTEEEAEAEEDDTWGLDAGFSGGSTNKKDVDPHLEAFLNERLFERRASEEQTAKEKSREDKLYEIPEGLQVFDKSEQDSEKMSWIAGLAEVPLGVEYKLANIEATEKAKREFLYGALDPRKKAAVLEPDAVTRKAFGSRFMHFKDNTADNKGATDDAVLERFRKRMKQ
mmetsp:Transcript_62873/g.180270  ORF Transcript_62873/g.180270 Transcript_62873/m.180270 type:complete len:227 (+) Transcript_62873:120-800(+)